MLSAAQDRFYWQLWAKLKRARPGVDRHAEHAALGLPDSHTRWHPKTDFDAWVRHCQGVADAKLPDDGEAKRKRVFIGHLLSALEQGEPELEALVAQMNRGGKFGGRMVTAGALSGAHLKGVMIALKKECRRRWTRKEYLVGEIHALRLRHDFDEAETLEAVQRALNTSGAPVLDAMVYEDLLVVLSVLRRLAGGAAVYAGPEAEHHAVDCPF